VKKAIPCPKCGSRILDAEPGIHTETKVIDPPDPGQPPAYWPPEYYVKCWKCKAKIGLRKVH